MAKKYDEKLMELDFYEELGLSINATEKMIKKCYRRKALECHPDKNPDNPLASIQFNQLKKILEILLDTGARTAYDKLLKGRKAAALRAREADAKSRKLKNELEERERQAELVKKAQPTISLKEQLKRELKRLEEEGERLIEEELEKVNLEVSQQTPKAFGDIAPPKPDSSIHRVKVKWETSEDWQGYTQQEIQRLFYKWGEINAVVLKQKKNRGTAMVEYKEKSGADMAVQFEKGLLGHPLTVSHIETVPVSNKKKDKKESLCKDTDYETVYDMNKRREEERRRIIEEMRREEEEAKT